MDQQAALEAVNETAWRDFVIFAWTQDKAHAAFRGASGRPQRSRAGSPIDLLIDKAVGGTEDDQYMTEFVDWVTKNHWGENYAPERWRSLKLTTSPASTAAMSPDKPPRHSPHDTPDPSAHHGLKHE